MTIVLLALLACPDCTWSTIAEEAAAADAEEVLKRRAPEVWRQLERDAARPELHALWGTSLNRDEDARATIVAPSILRALAARVGLRIDGDRVPAGITHTYGYLFSVLATPYGFKRARWLNGEIEAGLGLPRGLLGPAPPEGTLYANATWLFARLSLEGPRARELLAKLEPQVPRALRELDPTKLERVRLEERAVVDGRTIVLRTDCFRFPRARRGGKTHLVVYSIDDRLITGFPVDASFVAALTPASPVRARYNGWVAGLAH
jgi:hypothetical protein